MTLALVLTAGAASVFTAPSANAASARLTAFDQRMLVLVNDARADAGLPELQAATGLVDLSVWWSSQMADGATGYKLEHNPNAFDMTLSYGASNRTAWAENVAKWSPTSVTADEIFQAYWNSPGHKANILGAGYRYVGIGSVTGSNSTSWNTMTFTDKVEPGQAIVPQSPKGSVDTISVADGKVTVVGWAYDPNEATSSIPVHVYVNGAGAGSMTANTTRNDVNAAFGVTGKHGFNGSVPAVVGKNTVCVFAISVTGMANTLLQCKDVTWTPGTPPAGSLDSVTLAGSTITLSGWAYDTMNPSTSISVHVKHNGSAAGTIAANISRPDVNAARGITGNHGFSGTLTAKTGANEICVTASAGAHSTSLGCKTVTYAAAQAARGSLDFVRRDGSGIAIGGWAFDPSAPTTSTPVHVYINGVGTEIFADKSRNDVNAAFGITGNHGFTNTISAPSGRAEVCVFAISVSGGANTGLGCRTIEAAQATYGSVDTITRTAQGIRVAGWAVDPSSPSATIPVHIYVNGAGTEVHTDRARADVNAAYKVSGSHGFDSTVGAPAGSANVCVFAISVSGGSNTLLLCRTV